MSGIAMLLSILIGVLIFVSIVLTFFVFINSGLSARSLFYALSVFCISVYSAVGFVWTTWDGVEVEFLITVLKMSELMFPILVYALFMGALSFTMIGSKNYNRIGIIAALPVATQIIGVLFWSTSLTMQSKSVFISDSGEPAYIANTIGMVWSYATIFVFLGATFLTFSVAIKRQPDPTSKKLIKTATIGIAFSLVWLLGFDALVGTIPYAHSIGHVGLFVFVFALYRAFTHDYSVLDEQ